MCAMRGKSLLVEALTKSHYKVYSPFVDVHEHETIHSQGIHHDQRECQIIL